MNVRTKFDGRPMYQEDIIQELYLDRGVGSDVGCLFPNENSLLPLESLPHVAEAYNIIFDGIETGARFNVLFDCDLDGVTSGAEITRFLEENYGNVKTFINHGKNHGVQKEMIDELSLCDILIIVDSLDNTVENYKAIAERGVKIIVMDHHAVNPDIPYEDYVTLVTSQVNYGNPQLSGAGVVWKVIKYCDSRKGTNFSDKTADLAACGLVGDMVDMSVPENRYIVSLGLRNCNNLAIQKILGSYQFNSTSIAYSIAPLINASMRIGCNEVAKDLFITDDLKTVRALIRELKKAKELQQKEVERLLPSIKEQCENQAYNKMMVVIFESEYGVSGLLGNKLMAIYKRPILVLQKDGNKYRGSMRAVGVDDFRKIVNDSGFAQCDGHECAAGIKMPCENLEKLQDYIAENLDLELNEICIDADVMLNTEDLSFGLVNNIHKLDTISGMNFPPVKIYIETTSYDASTLKDGLHLKLELEDGITAFFWNKGDLFEKTLDASLMGGRLQLVGTVDISNFRGRQSISFIISDMDIDDSIL